ncbi:ABC transporter permease [Pseudorhodoplanes sp.]|uniref:ABC transporter permease n=1 Tax=Pseudorhodoplanes sp. TaxID=1934341 RepID=UPI003D0E1BB2
MLVYSVKRIALALAVGVFVSALSFFLLYAAGDPATAILGPSATQVDIDNVRRLYGFDRPIVIQYIDWLWRALQGNFGWSYFLRIPVEAVLEQRLPVTFFLGACSITFALVLAIPLGIAAALRPNSLVDRCALFLAVAGQAMPSFWFALMLVSTFSVSYAIFPVSGSETWRHFVLPTIVLGYYAMPAIMRLTRSNMIDVLGSDYIRTARSKGLSSAQIVFKHALRNAIVPVISLTAAQFGFMLAGSVVVESVFAIQGAGRLAWESIMRGDIPTMQAVILVFSMTYVLLTLLADLLNAWLNPRMRLG